MNKILDNPLLVPCMVAYFVGKRMGQAQTSARIYHRMVMNTTQETTDSVEVTQMRGVVLEADPEVEKLLDEEAEHDYFGDDD